MYVQCVWIRTCIGICVHAYIQELQLLKEHCVCMHANNCVCMCACMYQYTTAAPVCMYASIYICCSCMHVCIHIQLLLLYVHVCIHIQLLLL